MDQVSASEIALRIPDLLATVLRCLGPLEWVKCASVCPGWCDAILCRDEKIKAGEAVEAAATMAPTPATRAAAAPAVTADLWREFALTLMDNRNEDMVEEGNRSTEVSNRIGASGGGGRSFDSSEGSALVSCFDSHATGVITRYGRRLPSSNHVRGCFYRNVCLEGDPAVLGPPLRATTARTGNSIGRGGMEMEIAAVSLRDVAAASMARYRQRRVFIKFLSLWTRYGGPTIAKQVQLEVTQNDLRFTLNLPPGRKQASKRGSSVKAAAERASSRSNSGKRRASRPPKCCAATTAMLHEALSVFTRLLVLCRRCRRPCTTLFAAEDNSSSRRRYPSQTPHGGGAVHTSGKTMAPGSSRLGGGGVSLWIECQGEGCGVTSWVGVAAGTGGGGGSVGRGNPPPWLAKFSRFVLNRAWKDINTLAEDHGTEWFSDTSPAAVQRRQDEARARSIGLDALTSQGGGGDVASSDGD